jgi:glycosyltransferase involved in cell wall biosynthesis
MRVVHINTNDIVGGAGRAAFRLHTAMRYNGIDSQMFVLNKYKRNDSFIEVVGRTKITRWSAILKILIERIKLQKYNPYAIFSLAPAGFNITNRRSIRDADIIYLHWINRGLLSINGIENLLKLNKPVYWVLHDMWPFTGGCHYSFNCKQYMVLCGCCTLLQENSSATDISTQLLSQKMRHWGKYKNLHIITPSTWLANCAKESRLFNKLNITSIPNTIDLDEYTPHEKSLTRAQFGLRQDTKVVLFGAHAGADNPYKGWKYMQQALKNIKIKNIEAVVLGSQLDQDIIDQIPMRVTCTGTLTNETSLSALYSTADVFVSPSLVDNLPNTIVESMACDTPVVGFDTGGIPDLIKHKENGYLARYKDAEDLARGIEWVISQPPEVLHVRKSIIEMLHPEKIIKLHSGLWERDL